MSVSAAVAHAAAAAPLAALLPARRGVQWSVGPAPYGIRPNAATSRITDGRRALIVVEQGGRTEVYADRPDVFPVIPDASADTSEPDPVAALAARILRTVLPALDQEAAAELAYTRGREKALAARAADLQEVGFALLDHGAPVDVVEGAAGPGLMWTTDQGAAWGLWLYPVTPNLTLTYEGPVSGLYGLLPVLLPPLDGPAASYLPDVTSGFTWHMTTRFPQLRTVDPDEVEFGRDPEPTGFVALPARSHRRALLEDSAPVAAEVGSLGADLLLTAVSHLV
ncbi:hypothetical protein ABZ468_07635 [Streptomyces sp. NPDC005708]|uniref:hypothetical protein n=1 Tax=Streptomyces sp. NPDC005708 TaxID=3154564 RepID=UPI0033C5F98B